MFQLDKVQVLYPSTGTPTAMVTLVNDSETNEASAPGKTTIEALRRAMVKAGREQFVISRHGYVSKNGKANAWIVIEWGFESSVKCRAKHKDPIHAIALAVLDAINKMQNVPAEQIPGGD